MSPDFDDVIENSMRAANALVQSTAIDLRDIVFSDSMRGWAVGEEGTILSTPDGGKTWVPQGFVATSADLPIPKEIVIFSISLAGAMGI